MIFVKKVALSPNLLKSFKFLLLRKMHINIGYYLPSTEFGSGTYIRYHLPSKRFFSDIDIQNTQTGEFIEDSYINPLTGNIYDETIQPHGNSNDDYPPSEDTGVDDKQLHEDDKNDELVDHEEFINSINDSYYSIPNQEYTSFDPGYLKIYENLS